MNFRHNFQHRSCTKTLFWLYHLERKKKNKKRGGAFAPFRIIELEVIQVIILVFLFYLEVISYH